MKRFSEFRVGESFHSTCSISEGELAAYLDFARVRNRFLEGSDGGIVPGRAILARMEGEFSRLSQVYGNHIVLAGSDGDPEWGGRSTRFLRPLRAGDVLNLRFTVSSKEDPGGEFGRIGIDYEGTDSGGEAVVVSRRNIYRIKKEPPAA